METTAPALKRGPAAASTPAANAEPNGSEILVRCLQAENVRYLWGYPGGAVLYIYDALYKQQTIQHVLVRHEQAAVHAADGYARATGEVGVALVTSGPGVTNAVTGIATAYMDSIPMVIVTGQVPTPAIGLDAFQECDTVGITRPIVKHNFLVKDVRDLALTMKKAFHIARTGRPGPVVVDVPKDVSMATAPFHYPASVEMRSYNPVKKGHGGPDQEGGAAAARRQAALHLHRRRRRHRQRVGRAARADRSARLPVHEHADGPGRDRGERSEVPRHARHARHLRSEHDDAELRRPARRRRPLRRPRHRQPEALRVGRAQDRPHRHRPVVDLQARPRRRADRRRRQGRAAVDLTAQIREAAPKPDVKALSPWWAQINEWRKKDCLAYSKGGGDVIKPQHVIETLWQLTKDRETYITSDVGQHQMWAAQYYRFEEPRRWINSGGLGTMGVGLPYAMGIKLAKPEAEVVCITGEGSIQMCIQELSTCLQYKTPVKIVSLNNRYLGMVRQWQQIDYGGRYSHSYMDALPDFVKLAEAYGHVGIRIDKPSEVEPALREMLRLKDRTVFLDVRTDQTENVWPMVQAGKGITEMLLGSEDL